jgi:hypothetical protein
LLLPKGDENVALQDSSNDCSWNYVRDEVWWYLTTDGTCALPLLCMIFMILPSIILLALLVFSGWRLWRFRINNFIETESFLQEYFINILLVFQKGYALPFRPLYFFRSIVSIFSPILQLCYSLKIKIFVKKIWV